MKISYLNSLVKIAFNLKEIASEFFFPLSFRERPKIKYIKSLPNSTHGKDVIFYHKQFRIFVDFNVTDGSVWDAVHRLFIKARQ